VSNPTETRSEATGFAATWDVDNMPEPKAWVGVDGLSPKFRAWMDREAGRIHAANRALPREPGLFPEEGGIL